MKVPKIPTFPKWVRIATPIVLLLAIVGYLGVGWYFSGQLIDRPPQVVSYDQTIESFNDGKYKITGSAYDVDGIMGGIADNGDFLGVFSAPLSKDDQSKSSIRTLSVTEGPLPAAGDHISLQGNMWTTDPGTALGVDYEDVSYDAPLGPTGAWVIPSGDSSTWTIGVHGIGGTKQELLRFVKPVLASDSTMMIINYRGDPGNPAASDGHSRLGDTEWQDLEAAVRYAKSRGATTINLYGVSLGGSITENYLRRSGDVPSTDIKRVVLDSPALNWKQILVAQTKRSGYPGVLSIPGMTLSKWRAGIDFDRISTVPADIHHKTLIFHNSDDKTIPVAGSKSIADARPDLVTFYDFGTGSHIRAWNHDSARYETIVTDFLKN